MLSGISDFNETMLRSSAAWFHVVHVDQLTIARELTTWPSPGARASPVYRRTSFLQCARTLVQEHTLLSTRRPLPVAEVAAIADAIAMLTIFVASEMRYSGPAHVPHIGATPGVPFSQTFTAWSIAFAATIPSCFMCDTRATSRSHADPPRRFSRGVGGCSSEPRCIAPISTRECVAGNTITFDFQSRQSFAWS
jgi:hypothetical protein